MLRPSLQSLTLVLLLALAGAVAADRVSAQAGEGYIAAIPDLPLMPGLTEVPERGLVFDKPGGRIVEAFAEGSMALRAVLAFYDETLPQLGWRREAPGAYLREGERLRLDLAPDAAGVTVHFRLSPQ
jgi:hypothetical protein